jgi:hypothetical protein
MSLPKLLLLFLAVFALAIPLHADESAKTEAVAAMEKWLALVDDGKFAKSWKEASADFKKAVSEKTWEASIAAARTPLGKLESRKLASALEQSQIPSPDGTIVKGDFVIAQFDTAFKNLAFAVETVTFVREDGTWKVSGYYVRPKA